MTGWQGRGKKGIGTLQWPLRNVDGVADQMRRGVFHRLEEDAAVLLDETLDLRCGV
jgi:hypothetical protein